MKVGRPYFPRVMVGEAGLGLFLASQLSSHITLGKSQNLLSLTFHVYEVGWAPRGGRGMNDRKGTKHTAST